MKLRIYGLLVTFINMVLSLITFFLLLRIILKFFSTNPATPFVEWIFTVSNFLMIPFAGIVQNINTQTGILDIVAVITLLAYIIVGSFLLSLVQSKGEAELIDDEYPAASHYHGFKKG